MAPAPGGPRRPVVCGRLPPSSVHVASSHKDSSHWIWGRTNRGGGGLTPSSFAKTLFPKEHIPRFWAHMKWGIYQPTGAVKGEPPPSRGAGKPWLLLPSRERTSSAEKDSPDGGRSRGSWSEGPSQTRPGPSLIRTPPAEPAEVRPVMQGAVWGWGGGGGKPRLGLRSSPGLRSSLTSNTSLRGHGSDS